MHARRGYARRLEAALRPAPAACGTPRSPAPTAAGAARRARSACVMCGCGWRSEQRAPVRAQALGEAREVDHQRRVGERAARTGRRSTSRVALQRGGERTAAPPARRAVLVPGDAQDAGLFVEGDDGPEPKRNSAARLKGNGRPRRCLRGALQRHRPRARARLRRAGPGLRRRDRRRRRRRHLHAHDARVPDRTAGLRADGGVRRRARPASRRSCPTMVFTPPWSPEKMSEDAKFALGY